MCPAATSYARPCELLSIHMPFIHTLLPLPMYATALNSKLMFKSP